MRMACTQPEIGLTDAWVPHAILARPIESFLEGGLVYHEGIDREDFYRGVFGWVDGIGVALKAHAGAATIGEGADRKVTLYLSDRIPDEETAIGLTEHLVRALGVLEADLTRLYEYAPPKPVRIWRPYKRRARRADATWAD